MNARTVLGGSLAWVPLSALFLLAAFPPLEWHGLAWIALAPLIAGVQSTRGAGAWAWAAAGWAWGWVFWGAQFAWLYEAFVIEAGMGRLHFANAFGLLLAVLALGPAAALGLARAAGRRWGLSPLAVLPVAWAALDGLLGAAPFGGLGWGSLAGPQAHTAAAQLLVPFLGGAGLVLALGVVNAGWAAWARQVVLRWVELRAGTLRKRDVVWLVSGGLLWGSVTLAGAGSAPPAALGPAADAPAMLLVPGDLSLAELEAQRDTPEPVRYYLGRTLPALARRPDAAAPTLVVWPESAVPGMVERGQALVELARVGAGFGTELLLGSNARHRGRETNALYLVSGLPSFDFQRYDKQRLVPFGEYVPAGFGWLFRRKITSGEVDYAAGAGAPVLVWRGIRLGLAICFESILPGHVRAAVEGGADVLVAAANDAWLSPAARRQHLQLTALRGLEVGRDVVFVGNRGWAAHLRGGQALVQSRWTEGARWVRPVPRHGRTIFQRWGPWPWVVLTLGTLGGAAVLRGR